MEELFKKLGTTKQTIYKYENDIVTNIPSDRMEALSKVLQCSPAYIMGWDDGEASVERCTIFGGSFRPYEAV